MGADCESAACQGYVAVDALDFVVIKAICGGGKDARYLAPLFESVFGSGEQRVVGWYAGTVFDVD